jgi:hypothetical protein
MIQNGERHAHERDELDVAKLNRYQELSRLQLLAQLRDIVGNDELINLLCLVQKRTADQVRDNAIN